MHFDGVSMEEKPKNKFHEEDMSHSVKYPRLFLRLVGIWPILLDDFTTRQKCFSAFLIPTSLLSLIFVMVPPVIALIVQENDITGWIATFIAVTYYTSSTLRLCSFVFHYRSIKMCLNHVKTDWMTIDNEHDRVIMLNSVRFGHNLTVNCCIITSAAFVLFHVINPIWLGRSLSDQNVTVRAVANRGFDIIFDLQTRDGTYEMLFLFNCFAGYVSFNAINASCSFTAGFVSHACGQIQVIVSKLETLIDSINENDNFDESQNRLSLITQSHIRVLGLASRIEEVVRELCFLEVISATLIICMIEYYLVTERSNNNPSGMITYFISVASNVLNILLFCYIGEFLKEQGHQVGKAAYMMEWYRLPNKTIRDLMMIIIMDNTPPKITAGRIFELSIASFGAIMRMSLTYCNMLRAMTA